MSITCHVKMDSASRVSLEVNFARNASHGPSFSRVPGTKYHQQSSKCPTRELRETEMSVLRVSRNSHFLSSFMCLNMVGTVRNELISYCTDVFGCFAKCKLQMAYYRAVKRFKFAIFLPWDDIGLKSE